MSKPSLADGFKVRHSYKIILMNQYENIKNTAEEARQQLASGPSSYHG